VEFSGVMRRFKDVHKGKRIWVCSSGPSLADVDESRLTSDDVVIACNSAITHFKNADYFIWVDGKVTKFDWFRDIKPDQRCINLNPLVPSPESCIEVFEQSHDWGNWMVDDTGHFPGNIPQRAVSFAYVMGARQIVLAGCDCKGGRVYQESQVIEGEWDEDLYLWQMMKESNPGLPIVTISQDTPLTVFPSVRFNDLCA
jgi:hypothetical protein